MAARASTLLVLASLVLLAAPTRADEPAAPPVRIGFLSALTTGSAAFGEPALKAAAIAVDEVNAAGGIKGRKLELVVEDTQCNAKKASDAANKLVQVDRVKILLTHCSAETLAAAAIAEPAKVITFGSISSAPAISTAGDFVFRNSPPDTLGMKLLAEHVFKAGRRDVAVLVAKDPYTQSNRDDFGRFFAALGGKHRSWEFPAESRDLRAELTQIRHSGADALLFLPLAAANGAETVRQMRELEVGLPLYGNRILTSADAIKVAGDLLDGLVIAEVDFRKTDAPVAEFLRKYAARHGGEPGFALHLITGCYDAVNIVADGLRRCGEDTACIRDFLYSLKDYPTVTGKLTMDLNGDPILPYVIKTLRKGVLKNVE